MNKEEKEPKHRDRHVPFSLQLNTFLTHESSLRKANLLCIKVMAFARRNLLV